MKRSSYWYVRLLKRYEIRPALMGLVVFVGLALLFAVWVAGVGLAGGANDISFGRAVFELLVLGFASYTLGVTANALAATPKDAVALGPALDLDATSLARETAALTLQSPPIHAWSMFWVATAIVGTWWISGLPVDDDPLAMELSEPSLAGWAYFRNLVYVFTLSQLTWLDIVLARRLGRLLEAHGRVNLLDRSDLRPLAKRTRRNVLVWLPILAHSITFVVVVIVIVLLPAIGIRRRYADEKELQLDKVRMRIASRSAAVVDETAATESSSLPELVAWERRLQEAKVWPYDMTMALRIFLYAAVGFSSWVGAALVERLVEVFFG